MDVRPPFISFGVRTTFQPWQTSYFRHRIACLLPRCYPAAEVWGFGLRKRDGPGVVCYPSVTPGQCDCVGYFRKCLIYLVELAGIEPATS